MPTISVIGGTGNLGIGLAYRWAKTGHRIIVGSRSQDKADTARKELVGRYPTGDFRAMENPRAAEASDIVVVTVPFAAQRTTLEAIKAPVKGKIVVDTTVCLVPPKVGTVQLPPDGSAGQIAQSILAPDARVVSAFQNIAAHHVDSDHDIDCDVLICGNDRDACNIVVSLAADAGMRAYHAGPIENSAAVEGLTSILITLNRRYKADGAGIRLTNIPEA